MKKLIVFWLILILSVAAYSADSKVEDLPARMTTPDVNDVFYVVDDPCNTPEGQRIRWTDLFNGWLGSTDITTLGTIGTGVWNGTAIDISDYTNLTAGTHLTLTGDSLDVNTAAVTNGDTKHLATGDQIYDFVAGGYQTLTATKSRSFVIKSIAVADDFAFWQTPVAITITKVSAICSGGTNVVGCLEEYSGTATSPVDCNTADWTITTTEYETTSLTNGAIDAGDWIGWKTTSVSGTVTFFSLTFEYNQ